MEKIWIDCKNISEYLHVPTNYCFVDCAEVLPGHAAWGMKAVSPMDWYFKMHFPGNPMMPGVLIMETLFQTAALIIGATAETAEKQLLVDSCEFMRLYHSVRPGEVLNTCAELISAYDDKFIFRAEASSSKKETKVCSMRFALSLDKKSIEAPIIKERCEEGKIFDWENMPRYTADPLEYCFVDSVCAVPGLEAWGEKAVSGLEWCIQRRSSSETILPMGFVMESILQTGVFVVTALDEVSDMLATFHSCKAVQIGSDVHPGEQISTYAKLISYRGGVANYSGLAVSNGALICKMRFTLVWPGEMLRLRR